MNKAKNALILPLCAALIAASSCQSAPTPEESIPLAESSLASGESSSTTSSGSSAGIASTVTTSSTTKSVPSTDSATQAPTSAPTTGKPTGSTVSTTSTTLEYQNTVRAASRSYGGVDALGRVIGTDAEVGLHRDDKYVGIFYFLWLGGHGVGLYDNTQILATYADALTNTDRWGPVGTFHFWGEPLFGYYLSSDKWVIRKHVQMLTDADIDFIAFDTTNSAGIPTCTDVCNSGGGNNTYIANALAVVEILDEYYQMGWDVPQVVFYTNSNSGAAMSVIYNEFYKAYPQYSHLWFQWEGKPMIVGVSADASEEVSAFFRIKESQWPNSGKLDDGLPWMEFHRSLTPSAIYEYNGKSVMNVSIAQHNETCNMSASWYGSGDRTRSYSNGTIKKDADAVLWGYNFAEQWDFALSADPDMVFVTGWNEWIAQRQPYQSNRPIVFVDNASMEASRDAEPMRGGYGDNYYLQLIENIRKYKGAYNPVDTDHVTINLAGPFSQWNNIRAYYTDYAGDTVDRGGEAYGWENYTNTTGRNDIVESKVCYDDENVYFFVKTASPMTAPSGNNWMNLYLSTGNSKNPTWCGYDFVLNRIRPSNGTATLEKCTKNDSFFWKKATSVSYTLRDDLMMLAIPRAVLGLTGDTFSLQFKWTDNCQSGDIFSFYTDGDAAPLGRLNYIFDVR